MTKSTPTASETSGKVVPTQFKAILALTIQKGDDAGLLAFLRGYALGVSADEFIGAMNTPGQRVEFLAAIAKTYPEDWKATVERLEKEG